MIMKKLLYLCIPVIAAAIIVPFACSKDTSGRTDDLPALQPAKTDADAGTWKPILLSSATEFAVAAPIAVTSPDYLSLIHI